jgi:hypothetical protein
MKDHPMVPSGHRMKLVLAVIMFCWPSVAFSADWFVRQSCVNNGNGAASSCAVSPGSSGAWRGFSNITWGSISPGDRLNLVSGETYSPPLNIGASGTEGNPITITVSGAGTAVIDMNNIAGPVGVNFLGKEYVILDGVRGNRVAGVNTYGLKITNIASSGSTKSFCIYNSSALGVGGHNKVLHVECSGSSQAQPDDTTSGMFINSCFWEIAYNWVHSSTIPNLWWGTAISHLCLTPAASTNYDDDVVHHNQVEYMNDDGIRCGSNCSVYNNILKHFDSSGGSHADPVVIQSASYVAVYNNYIENSIGQNILLDNIWDSTCGHIRIYNNIINSDLAFGIVLDPSGGAGTAPVERGCVGSGGPVWDDVVIANNTIFNTSSAMIRVVNRGRATNLVVLNNIFGATTAANVRNVQLQSSTSLASSVAWDHNVYSTSNAHSHKVADWPAGVSHTLAELQALSPARELNGVYGVPVYVNPETADFHLAPNDVVARGKGINLTSMYPYLMKDKDGVQRSLASSWDIGAYGGFSGSTQNPRPLSPFNIRIQ